MEINTEVQEPTRFEPRTMCLFGKPKTGKTDCSAALTREDNWLLIELEKGGADAIKCRHVDCDKLKELYEVLEEVNKDPKKYNFKGCIIDTATRLEEMASSLAKQMYKATPIGKIWEGNDITTLPNGAGYGWIRKAFLQITKNIENSFDKVIYLAHTVDKSILIKGEEANSKEISLGGKLSAIFAANIDAIGYVFREENETKINFKASLETVCGNRFPYLADETIVIAESDEKKNMTYHWDKIFPSMKKEKEVK